ncbi:xylulokinase [Microbacterium sp. P03]|uniref:xylulokinase n=1 Tax=Microbacterium sp. P03 TaxID=3366946 RepID=UPI0037466818
MHGDSTVPGVSGADQVRHGRGTLGVELGSTRIKASLIGSDHSVLATGSFEWSSRLIDGSWTYPLGEVWTGLQAAVRALLDDCERSLGVRPSRFAAIGISAMMHGYLAFDGDGGLLVPFRTWRNTTADEAARQLTAALGCRIPRRWSVAHLYQAMLDAEPHVADIRFLTTLAGYVHWQLTDQRVLGLGDASGMFPIDSHSHQWDARRLEAFDRLAHARQPGTRLSDLLPIPLNAGADGGSLTARGALLLDPSGGLEAGSALCPPEGDAGTGMVATNSVAVRTGNISVGTSVFAMIVLEASLPDVASDVDLVTTPSGERVAMIHCINGTGELAEWASVFESFSAAIGNPVDRNTVFRTLLSEALDGDDDCGGLLAYNFLAGEPIVGVSAGRPMLVRTPGSRLTLANLIRAQIFSSFGALSIGLRALEEEGVAVDTMHAHGGLFTTAGVGQKMLAAAIGHPVAVVETASEGGSWGIAVLAAYRSAVRAGDGSSLADYLETRVFAGAIAQAVVPHESDIAGYLKFLERYRAGLAIERVAEIAM